MYRDNKLIKEKIVKVRFDHYLDRRIEAMCDLTGDHKAVVVRNLVELGLSSVHGANSATNNVAMEGLIQGVTST